MAERGGDGSGQKGQRRRWRVAGMVSGRSHGGQGDDCDGDREGRQKRRGQRQSGGATEDKAAVGRDNSTTLARGGNDGAATTGSNGNTRARDWVWF